MCKTDDTYYTMNMDALLKAVVTTLKSVYKNLNILPKKNYTEKLIIKINKKQRYLFVENLIK